MYLVGHIPAHNRVYVADKDLTIYGFGLSLAYIEYQTAVLRGDLNAAAEILPAVPPEQRNKVARFLEGQGKYLFLNEGWGQLKIFQCRPQGIGTAIDQRFRPQIRSCDFHR
jgi:Coatomer WD associated region